jgi:hypothetical protein
MKPAVQRAIERAIEGGYDPFETQHGHQEHHAFCYAGVNKSELLLDPLFWQAIGKVEGWKAKSEQGEHSHGRTFTWR